MMNIRTLVKVANKTWSITLNVKNSFQFLWHPPEVLVESRLDLELFGMASDCDFFRKELLKECFTR